MPALDPPEADVAGHRLQGRASASGMMHGWTATRIHIRSCSRHGEEARIGLRGYPPPYCVVVGITGTYLEWKLCRRASCWGFRDGVGPMALTLAPLLWLWFKRGGSRGLELRIDREGFMVRGRIVPWGAVMSLLWRVGDDAGEHIEVRVRSIEGYRAPRDGSVQVFHRQYGVPANVLIDAFEAAALPRRIYVLAVEPPSDG